MEAPYWLKHGVNEVGTNMTWPEAKPELAKIIENDWLLAPMIQVAIAEVERLTNRCEAQHAELNDLVSHAVTIRLLKEEVERLEKVAINYQNALQENDLKCEHLKADNGKLLRRAQVAEARAAQREKEVDQLTDRAESAEQSVVDLHEAKKQAEARAAAAESACAAMREAIVPLEKKEGHWMAGLPDDHKLTAYWPWITVGDVHRAFKMCCSTTIGQGWLSPADFKQREAELKQQIKAEADELLKAKDTEIERLRNRLLTAAGDDLCRLTQEEIKAMGAGTIKIPPKEEFLASCERFHAQVAAESGVMTNCLTLAQLVAENERLQAEAAAMLAHAIRALEFDIELSKHGHPRGMEAACRKMLEEIKGGTAGTTLLQRLRDAEAEKLQAVREEQRAVEDVFRLSEERDEAQATVERLKFQLPLSMRECTILFKECMYGHGRLIAMNWMDHGCDTCLIERLKELLRNYLSKARFANRDANSCATDCGCLECLAAEALKEGKP